MGEAQYRPLERRPIEARKWGLSRAATRWLVRRGITPNTISIAGMLAGLGAGAAFVSTSMVPALVRGAWLLGAALVQLRLLANMLDGMVAVEAGKASPVGELYNEVPDRVSDAAVLIGLGFAQGGHPYLGFAATIAAILTAYVRAAGRIAGAPQDYCGPMAKQHRMFLVTVLGIYSGLMPAGWQLQWTARSDLGLSSAILVAITLGSLLTAARRLLRCSRALRQRV